MAQDIQAPYQLPAYCLVSCGEDCMNILYNIEITISGLFTVITTVFTMYYISKHFNNFNNPFLQSKIIVILFMPVFYSVTTMGSFIIRDFSIYFNLARGFYQGIESIVFFDLIFAYLSYEPHTCQDKTDDIKVYKMMANNQKQIPYAAPQNICLKPFKLSSWRKAKYFTYRCKRYVLQYVIFTIISTLAVYILYPNQFLNKNDKIDGKFVISQQQKDMYALVNSILTWIGAASSIAATAWIDLFYNSLDKALKPFSPVLKFFTVKWILFLTFWQKSWIQVLNTQITACFDHDAPSFNQGLIVSSLQNTLLCIQMLVLGYTGALGYSYESYVLPKNNQRGSFLYIVKDTIRSFQHDLKLVKIKPLGFKQKKNRQYELQQINWLQRESATTSMVMKSSLKDIMIENYF